MVFLTTETEIFGFFKRKDFRFPQRLEERCLYAYRQAGRDIHISRSVDVPRSLHPQAHQGILKAPPTLRTKPPNTKESLKQRVRSDVNDLGHCLYMLEQRTMMPNEFCTVAGLYKQGCTAGNRCRAFKAEVVTAPSPTSKPPRPATETQSQTCSPNANLAV